LLKKHVVTDPYYKRKKPPNLRRLFPFDLGGRLCFYYHLRRLVGRDLPTASAGGFVTVDVGLAIAVWAGDDVVSGHILIAE
jgi:hypothetical protein